MNIIEKLIKLLVGALICLLLFYVCGLFIGGMILKIIGAILALAFILFALRLFDIINI